MHSLPPKEEDLEWVHHLHLMSLHFSTYMIGLSNQLLADVKGDKS